MTLRPPGSLLSRRPPLFFFFNDTATTEIYTLSLHDALPIFQGGVQPLRQPGPGRPGGAGHDRGRLRRSEEHTSELQSQSNLVCRLLLEKKKKLSTPDFPSTPADPAVRIPNLRPANAIRSKAG